jgi:hypothetical protein
MRLGLAVLVLAGCTESRSPVHGSIAYRYPDGTQVPVDLSGQLFQAYVLDGAGYVAHPQEPVAGTAAGTFEIPDVPDGPFVLRRSTTGFYGVFAPHDDHEVEEIWDVLGRPTAAPASAPTMVELDASGLAAWQAGDTLFVDCFGNASELVDPDLTPPLAAGATSISASFDWSAGYSWGASGMAYLMDAAAGDEVVIAHTTTTTSGGIRTSAVTQVLAAAAPTQIAGQASQVTGAFVDVAATSRLKATVPGDELAATLEPGVSPGDEGVVIVAGPGTESGALLGPELARVSTRDATGAMNASVAYGNPFDAAWPPRVTAWYTASRHLDAGHRGPLDIAYTAFTDSAPLRHDQFRLDPLAPVTTPTLDGEAIAGQTIAIPAHQPLHLDFVAPAEATKGRVIVWRVDKPMEAGYVEVAGPPVDLPIDIFQDGGRYAFQIDVYADDGAGRLRSASLYTDAVTIVGR